MRGKTGDGRTLRETGVRKTLYFGRRMGRVRKLSGPLGQQRRRIWAKAPSVGEKSSAFSQNHFTKRAKLCYNRLGELGIAGTIAPEPVLQQSAYGVCRAAEDEPVRPAAELLPVYLRLSQAERERQSRMPRT